MKSIRGCVLATLTVASSGALFGQGSSDAELAEGIRQVDDGYYDKAMTTLDAVVRRLTADGRHPKDLERAHVYLGVACVGVGRLDQARAQFRSAISSMVVQPGGKRGKIKDVTLAPFAFSPKVTGVFEEAKREAMAEVGEKEGHFPVLLAAVGAVGGGAAVVLAAKGGEGSAPPTPSPFHVAFVNSSPPPGSTISVGAFALTVDLSVSFGTSGPYVVGANFGPGPCVGNNVVAGVRCDAAVNLTAGQEQSVRLTCNRDYRCALAEPTRIDTLWVALHGPEGITPFYYTSQSVPVSYTFVP